MKPGDSVLLRTVVRGRVRNVLPVVYVDETPDLVALYAMPGTEGRQPTTSLRGGNLRSYDDGWQHEPKLWRDNHALWLSRFEEPYSLNLFWDATWTFLGWYVQLQDPLRRSRLAFDTRDHLLDVTVEPDGSWAWKDEDELARAVELSLFTEKQAATIRANAERVIETRPWPTGWDDWRPDPGWELPTLREGWDVA